MHFAAGANSPAAVKIIASFGAKMNVEANNGYTPYHWAQRLSNREVLEEFQHLGADNRFVWSFGSPSNNNNDGNAHGNNNNRLASFFANRFFSSRPVFTQ
jgi:ankyrin repeat protein